MLSESVAPCLACLDRLAPIPFYRLFGDVGSLLGVDHEGYSMEIAYAPQVLSSPDNSVNAEVGAVEHSLNR